MPVRLENNESDSKLPKKPGPKPKCECGDCKICNNRRRQRAFYIRKLLRTPNTGVDLNEQI